MVESTKNQEDGKELGKAIEQLVLSLGNRITCEDIEFDIYQTEKTTKDFMEMPEKEKKFLLIKNSEKRIVKFIYETKIDIDSLTYVKLKEKLIENFSR